MTNGVRFFVEQNNDDPVLKTAMIFEDGTCAVGLYNFSTSRQNARNISFPSVCQAKSNRTVIKTRTYLKPQHLVDMDPYGYWVGTGVTRTNRID